MNRIDMEYNSSRETLIIPEYGRHVQMLVDHAKTIEDRAERQVFVEKILDLMMQMHPQNRNLDDYRAKLWKHVFRISNYELDVDFPDGMPDKEEMQKKPERIPYPHKEARFRHYGYNVQRLIKKAIAMEDEGKRNGFVKVIGSYMKLAYRTWNKEHYVSDDVIKQDLESLSKGELNVDDEMTLDNLATPNRRSSGGGRRRSNSGGSNKGRSNRGRGKRK
jgi:hypothetical protein